MDMGLRDDRDKFKGEEGKEQVQIDPVFTQSTVQPLQPQNKS